MKGLWPALLAALLVACGSVPRMTVTSPAFAAGGTIPARFTCAGSDVSPPLAWSAPPAATRSLVVLVDDPDAPGGDFTHWLVYRLAPGLDSLAAGSHRGLQGRNGFGRLGYGGPCPPSGPAHRYRFHVIALNDTPRLAAGAGRAAVDAAIKGHILAEGVLEARFGR